MYQANTGPIFCPAKGMRVRVQSRISPTLLTRPMVPTSAFGYFALDRTRAPRIDSNWILPELRAR